MHWRVDPKAVDAIIGRKTGLLPGAAHQDFYEMIAIEDLILRREIRNSSWPAPVSSWDARFYREGVISCPYASAEEGTDSHTLSVHAPALWQRSWDGSKQGVEQQRQGRARVRAYD